MQAVFMRMARMVAFELGTCEFMYVTYVRCFTGESGV